MKRDMELIRKLLIFIEEHNSSIPIESITIEGYDDSSITYHIRLLKEAGLIDADITKYMDGYIDYIIYRLTWDGHEFLETIKNENVWTRIKQTIKDKGGQFLLMY